MTPSSDDIQAEVARIVANRVVPPLLAGGSGNAQMFRRLRVDEIAFEAPEPVGSVLRYKIECYMTAEFRNDEDSTPHHLFPACEGIAEIETLDGEVRSVSVGDLSFIGDSLGFEWKEE